MYTPPAAYRQTLALLHELAPTLLLTAHEPPLEGDAVGAFLDDSARAAERLEELVRQALAAGPVTLAGLCERVAGDWDGLPASAAESLAMSLDGILGELVDNGDAELVSHDPRRWSAA
jgi:hypothetical protein